MKKVSAIIVNYNTKDILRDCIKNLEGQYQNFELIIVDNNSPDGSAQMVKENFPSQNYPWIKLIESENNGLAAGSNLGLEASSGDYLLYMGSDAFPKPGTIDGMVTWMEEHADAGAATSKLVQRDLKLDMDAHRGFPTPWTALTHFSSLDKIFPKSKIFNGYFKGYLDLNSPHEIDLCIAHFMMIKKEVLNKVGKWDTDFFLYGEDVDMCWRIKEAGWKIYYLPMWETTHYKGASIGVRSTTKDITTASAETKLKMHKTSTSAMKIFYKKHLMNKYPKILTALIFFAVDAISFYRLLKVKLETKKQK